MVGNWLYGVAYRTAMKARAMRVKRQAKERRMAELPRVQAPVGEACEELLMQLDHELNRLSDRYRVPVVLCELEDRSRREAARMLGIPEGTLSSRLAQAKKLLARKLSRYGTMSLAALLSASAASACLTPALRSSTLKTVFSAGSISAKVLALTEGVMKAMLLSKLKMTMCAAALMVLAGVGASGLTYRATAEEPKRVEYRKVYVSSADSRPATDDLEALRLEIESLRKELRATKERVKALEEANAQLRRNDTRSRAVETPQREQRPQALNKELRRLSDMLKSEKSLAGVEEALRQMLANPENKQAAEAFERAIRQQVTEALEQALKQLKEPEKPTEAGPKKN
jgi:hypothetical protein